MFLEEAGTNQILMLLLVGIIGIVLLVVALVAYLVLGGRGKRKEERSLAVEPTGLAQEKTPEPVDDSQPFFEVLRVLRDRTNNNIIVEVGGRRYKRLADIRDGRVGRQIVQAAADLVKFAGVMGVRSATWAADQAPEPQEPAAPQPSPLPDKDRTMLKPRPEGGMLRFIDNPPPEVPEVKPPAPQPPATEKPDRPKAAPSPAPSALPPETAEFLSAPDQHGVQLPPRDRSPTLSPSPAETPDKPSIGGFFGRVFKPTTTAPTPQRSMIDEIEDILQQLIARAPSPLGREIHVRTGPDGAIQLDVDGVIYHSADEVSDVVARELIKAAVRQWEKSQ